MPITNQQIAAMTADQVNDRLCVAAGHGRGFNAAGLEIPYDWDLDATPSRREVRDLLGQPPRPWPPNYCGDRPTALLGAEEVGYTGFSESATAMQIAVAALQHHNSQNSGQDA
jgi:hypothetical protein